jgi:hypothetical protein
VHIAILTFDGFNELDSLIAVCVLNRIKKADWRVTIATSAPTVRSMNGVTIESMASLDDACDADAVIVGIARLEGREAAESALHYVAPVGEKEEYVARAWRNISPYLPAVTPALA